MQASSNVSHVHPHAKRVSISINVNNVHLVTIKINKITIATKHAQVEPITMIKPSNVKIAA